MRSIRAIPNIVGIKVPFSIRHIPVVSSFSRIAALVAGVPIPSASRRIARCSADDTNLPALAIASSSVLSVYRPGGFVLPSRTVDPVMSTTSPLLSAGRITSLLLSWYSMEKPLSTTDRPSDLMVQPLLSTNIFVILVT